MLDSQTIEKLKEMASQVATRENCSLYDLEFVGAGTGRILRVFIDKAGEDSVSVEDCSNVSNGLNLILDVEDIIPGGAYNLEVSSPGLERHLKEKAHFEGALGELIFLKTRSGFANFSDDGESLGLRKQGQVKLVSVIDEKNIEVDINGARLSVPLDEIEKSHVIFETEDKTPPKSGGRRSQRKKKSKKR